MSALGDREAAVLDRIEAFRRRRPRLTDDVITLAHGAGGKASAALVDAVFVEAFAGDSVGSAGRRRHAHAAHRRAAGVHHRLVRRASRGDFPAARSAIWPCTARSTTSRSRARTPMWLSGAFVIEEGFADRRAARDRGRHGRGRGRRRASPSSPATPRWSSRGAADGAVHHDRRCRRRSRPGDARARAGSRRRRRARVGHHRRSRHGGDAGPRRPDARGRHPIRHGAARRARRVAARLRRRRRDGCATRRVAAWGPCATSWPATRTSPSCSTRPCCRSTRRSRVPATCWASTRCTWPTRASSSPSSRRRGRRRARRDARRIPSGATPTRIGEIVADPQGIVVLLTTLRRDPHRRHARRRSAPPHLLTVTTSAERLRVTGTVQGVGFRPFVYRQAVALGLVGYVLQRQRGRADRGRGSAERRRRAALACCRRRPAAGRVAGGRLPSDCSHRAPRPASTSSRARTPARPTCR